LVYNFPIMLRRLAILVFLTIVLPIYGCKESPKTGGDKNDSNSPKPPTAPPSRTARCVVKEEGTTIECNWAEAVPESKFQRLFSPENAPNIALFLVGVGGIGVALCTLRKMERQTRATEVAANAAKISADIAVGTSLPTLVIHELGTGDTGTADVEAFFQSPKIKISIKNYGQTPAFLKWWTLCFTCEALPELPNYYHGPADGMILDKVVVQPDTIYTLPELFFPHRQEFSVEDARAIVRGEKTFRVYGYVCYGDIFGNPLKRLKFCETVLNILGLYSTEEVCDWWEGFCPPAYTGTDLLPTTKEPAQQKTENPN
jgi:hypothetical protein